MKDSHFHDTLAHLRQNPHARVMCNHQRILPATGDMHGPRPRVLLRARCQHEDGKPRNGAHVEGYAKVHTASAVFCVANVRCMSEPHDALGHSDTAWPALARILHMCFNQPDQPLAFEYHYRLEQLVWRHCLSFLHVRVHGCPSI